MGADQVGRPPRLPRWLLSRLLPCRLKPTAAGDFEELYRRVLAEDGRAGAAAWYWRQVLRSVPAFFLAALRWRLEMFAGYLKLALRHSRRRPGLAAVNVGGLAVGLAGCVLAFFFVHDEFAYDRFHRRVDRVYEVKSKVGAGERTLSLETQGPVGPALAAEFPEVEAAVRLGRADVIVRAGGQAFIQDGLGADPSFFDVFSFPLTAGDPATALREPYSVVLGGEAARLCFGTADPVGRTVSIKVAGETADYKVTGVAAAIPARSSLDFDLLLPIVRIKGPAVDRWGPVGSGESPDAACFIRLRDGADAGVLASKFPATLDKHMTRGDLTGSHYLFPFARYHRGAGDYSFSSVLKPRSAPVYSVLLTSLALLVLVIAGMNFMNLSVGAAAADRAREIGIRKVFGARQGDLLHQFRVEGVLMALAGLAGGLGIARLVLPAFNALTGKGLRLDALGDGRLSAALVLLAVLLGTAAGSYPGWSLSRPRPTELVRGAFFLGRRSGFNRAFLVFQFAIAVFLVTTTGFLYRQHRYLAGADLGYEAGGVVALDLRQLTPGPEGAPGFMPALKARLLQHPEVRSVSWSESGMSSWSARVYRRGGSSSPTFVRSNGVDPDYLGALGLRLVEGRWFSSDFPSDARDAVVVNETFARIFAPASAVGRSLSEVFATKSAARIVGVVRDFHFDSLRRKIDPAMIGLIESSPRWAYVRLAGDDLRSALETIEKEFKAAAPGYPFLWSFLDREAARQYESEARWSVMISIVSLFAVLIACAGVFALAIQASIRRTKEIGVRRVVGASGLQVVSLLSGEFARLAAAAGVLAWPAVWLAVRKVLAGYPYRIALSPWTFLAGGGLVLVLVLVTAGLHALRIARTKPVDALRCLG
jgi:putative ABC transport system permease protein